MSLPGLLIEYLINGCIALIWISSFNIAGSISDLSDAEKFLIIPIAYVLGMFIDFIAWFITKPIKRLIRKDAFKVIQNSVGLDNVVYNDFWNEKVEIEKSYPDLNKELKSRSSRDRIARGTIINLIAISICYWTELSWIGIVLTLICIAMWVHFEHYNRCYEIRAVASIRNEVKA